MKISRKSLRQLIESVVSEETETASATLGNIKGQCMNLLNTLTFSTSSKKQDAFIKARDSLINLKSKSEAKDILADFDKKLAGAYLFGKRGVSDEDIKAKFDITGTDADAKIKDMQEQCSKK